MGNFHCIMSRGAPFLLLPAVLLLIVCAPPVPVEFTLLAPQDVTMSVSAEGRIAAQRVVSLSFPVAGIIDAIRVAERSVVRRGDTLVTLATTEGHKLAARRRAELAAAQVALERLTSLDHRRAEERLEQARLQEAAAQIRQRRNDTMLLQGSITRAEADEGATAYALLQSQRLIAEAELAALATSDLKLAESRRMVARHLLDEAFSALAHTQLIAPFDGKVITVPKESGVPVFVAQPVISLARSNEALTALVSVTTAAVHHLRAGQKALVTTVGAYRFRFDAVVREIDFSPENSGMTMVTLVSTEPLTDSLADGTVVDVRIVTGQAAGALVVGRHFIHRSPDGDMLFVKKGNRARKVAVRVADAGEGRYLVLEGAAVNDTVVTAENLYNGAALRLRVR